MGGRNAREAASHIDTQQTACIQNWCANGINRLNEEFERVKPRYKEITGIDIDVYYDLNAKKLYIINGTEYAERLKQLALELVNRLDCLPAIDETSNLRSTVTALLNHHLPENLESTEEAQNKKQWPVQCKFKAGNSYLPANVRLYEEEKKFRAVQRTLEKLKQLCGNHAQIMHADFDQREPPWIRIRARDKATRDACSTVLKRVLDDQNNKKLLRKARQNGAFEQEVQEIFDNKAPRKLKSDNKTASAEKPNSNLTEQVQGGNAMSEQPAASTAMNGAAKKPVTQNPAKGDIKTHKGEIAPRSDNQAEFIDNLRDNQMTFGLGDPGTGKTFLAVAVAVEMLQQKKIDRIIATRPAVEAGGEKLGFLPGDLREKIDPYLRPLYDALHEMVPAEKMNKHLDNGEIEIAPLAFMRGRTLKNAFVIGDEIQNITPEQMHMLLTRLGENSQMALVGDPSQNDLQRGQVSGLQDILDRNIEQLNGVAVTHFGKTDIVRPGIVGEVQKLYEQDKLAPRPNKAPGPSQG